MKLSDYKNEDALELLADIIEPATEILSDPQIAKAFRGATVNKVNIAKVLLKNHKTSIVKIMAVLEGVPYEKYEFNLISGTMQVLELLNDEELISFFRLQGQMIAGESSGSVTENIGETEKM